MTEAKSIASTSATAATTTSATAATTTSAIAVKRVALVTGGNAGFGYYTVEALAAAEPSLTVLVGARSSSKGDEAVRKLHAAGHVNCVSLLIDINDTKSIAAAAERIKSEFGGLDILVNNAGVGVDTFADTAETKKEPPPAKSAAAAPAAPTAAAGSGSAGGSAGANAAAAAAPASSPSPSPMVAMVAALKVGGATAVAELKTSPLLVDSHGADGPTVATMAEAMFDTNYYGTKRVSEALFPLLRENARVVLNGVLSLAYYRFGEPHLDIPPQLFSAESSTAKIEAMLTSYISDHRAGKLEGWPVVDMKFLAALGFQKGAFSVYQFSKMAANALTYVQARDNKRAGVSINVVAPGQAATKLNGYNGPSPAVGAGHIARVCLLPPGAPSGVYYMGGEACVWA